MIPAVLLKLALGGFNILKVIGHAINSFFAALNVQGWVGLCASLLFGIMALNQHGEARHWKKQSGQFEKLYHTEQTAFAQTVANYRVAAEKARLADAANKARVEAEQRSINERTSHDYQARIAAARAIADRLRGASSSHPSGSRTAPVSGVPASASGPSQDTPDGLSDALTATEQAIQLDELIKWVERQHAIDPNKP